MTRKIVHTTIHLSDIPIDVAFKHIKNLHLRVDPGGRVRISAPAWMELDAVRAFALSRLNWIQKQRNRLQEQQRVTPRGYADGESHPVWGKSCRLSVVETSASPAVTLEGDVLILRLRSGTNPEKKQAVLDAWYRRQVLETAPPLIARWEKSMGVSVQRFHVRRMKTRWGSCTPATGTIRLNSELAKRPPECLEYVIVHELAHLLEPSHNGRFKAIMDRFLPGWRLLRTELKRSPLGHGEGEG